jgi:PhnB protein
MSVHEVYPYLCVTDTAAAIDFYARAFSAREKFRLVEPSGRIGHAEIELGGVTLMLCDEFPEYGIRAPQPVEAGATLERPAADAFYGERSGSVIDPFGHRWLIGHSIEEVSPEEMQRRYTALFNEDGKQ